MTDDNSVRKECRRAAIQARLDHFTTLKSGWDGRWAHVVHPLSVENVRKVILDERFDPNLWFISPGVNGDIYINYKGDNVRSGVVVSEDKYTYFIEDNLSLTGKENQEFDVDKIIRIMKEVETCQKF